MEENKINKEYRKILDANLDIRDYSHNHKKLLKKSIII